jgi:pimeloyl-ACP methyl ester carboxylesterase
MLDEHEFQAKDVYSHNTPSGEPTWEDTNWLRARGRLVRFGRGGSRLGGTLWSPLNSRAGRQGRMNGTQEDAVDRSAATERDGTCAPMVLQRAMLMTGKPGESSLAVRRWQELMRWTNARMEYLDTTGIDADALGDISAPVRLVYGARSLYRPSALKMKKLLPQAHLRIVPRAGHCFPLLRPQGLLEAMETPVPGAQDAGPAGSRQRLRLAFSGRAETADLHRRELGEPARSTSGSPRP